ncbi:acyl-CoA dehydrogenase family protein [Reyranella sp. CPCC 100927]|uniref:acyl-CoA dehydrogenase family protein n=1 Tax=Reyranella sp. CPCC 100927 TaxID=2599616 RepID=UPI0011B70DE2|nr:acyl-CoA dehydrogenase family protein [Reyranella sp. CPCC 100927]TWS95679.1 acyl-CoA dehydrogenase [Reyranella sp. CPCC 100927]
MTVLTPTVDLSLLAELSRAFAARADAHDRDASFAFENIDQLRETGFLALVTPRDHGGAGRGLAAAAKVIGLLAEGDPSTALVLSMQYISHASIARSTRWPPSVRHRVFDDAVRHGGLINALRVEPALGSPARGGLPATTARRTDDGAWRLSGHKIYATGIPALRWLLVWARTDIDGQPQVGSWLVPSDSAGIEVIETWDHVGMRATSSHDVVLTDVVVPADHAVDIRPPGEWTPDPTSALWNTVLIAAVYDGIARAARDWLVVWLNERVPANLGASLATLPRFQEAVGDIDARLLVNRRLIGDTARRTDQDPVPASAAEAGLVKYVVTQNAHAVVERALSLTGNHGLSRRNPLERHHRNVLCSRVHTPQDDSSLIAAGREALGVRAA